MFISNGFVYGGSPKGSVSVAKALPLGDMMMLITFTTGETRLFDATILSGPVFEPLRNPDVFKNAEVDHGVITWMNGAIDCAPEFMYEHSYEYSNAS